MLTSTLTNVPDARSPEPHQPGANLFIRHAAIRYAAMTCSLGLMLVAATERGLCFLQFGEAEDELVALLKGAYPSASLEPLANASHPNFDRWTEAIRAYLEGSPLSPQLPVDVAATAFRQRVWQYLRTIRAGEVRSYAEVAADLGQPTATRAVASACAANPVAVLIPCHRILRSDGRLGGYRWGLDRKRALLALEKNASGVKHEDPRS